MVALPLVLCASPTFAEEPAPVASTALRLRFGLGVISGATQVNPYNGNYSDWIATLFGLELRIGVQLNDRFAVMYQTSGTFLWPQFANALLVEFTPIDYVSIGVGAGIYWIAAVANGSGSCDGPPGAVATCGSPDQTLSAGIPIRLAFNLPWDRSPGEPRRALSLSVTMAPAWTLSGAQDLGTEFQLVVLGGIGFELY